MQNIGIISNTYLSKGEFMEVERIAAKHTPTQKELSFIIAMANRSKTKLQAKHQLNDVVIQRKGKYFFVMNLTN